MSWAASRRPCNSCTDFIDGTHLPRLSCDNSLSSSTTYFLAVGAPGPSSAHTVLPMGG
jgi:hypothetical protein